MEGFLTSLEKGFSLVGEVANGISDPRNVRLSEKVKIVGVLKCEFFELRCHLVDEKLAPDCSE